ncbi:MAG: hypothetical protein ACFFBD_09910, partial [Candidatus Hodarchaeota archaeon]
MSKIRQLARSFFIPEVTTLEREKSFREKLAWTFGALIVYFVMTTIPLYGVSSTDAGADPFFWVRTVMASSRGTFAELGIGPIITAGLIMLILNASKKIQVDLSNPEERARYTGTQRILAVGMTIFEAIAYILGGAYPSAVGNTLLSLIIFVQLVAAGILIILLCEKVQKIWGYGIGISLFIAGGVAQGIFWNTLAMVPAAGIPAELPMWNLPDLPNGRESLSYGAIIAFIEVLQVTGGNILTAITVTFLREENTPGLLSIITTLIVFLIVIYFESMRIEIPASYAKYRGFKGKYPFKLLYVSNIPVMLVFALFADAYFIVLMIWNNWNKDNTNILL